MGLGISGSDTYNTVGTDFQWSAISGLSDSQKAQVQAGNYGSVQDAIIQDDKVVVTTDLGTLTIGRPQLAAPSSDTTPAVVQSVAAKLPVEQNGINLFAAMTLLFQAAQEQSTAARQMRQTQMQAQEQASLQAASDLRSGAGWALAGSIVSGAISIGSGAMGAMQGAKMTSMASSMESPAASVEPDAIEMEAMGASKGASSSQSEAVNMQNMKIQSEIQAMNTKTQGWQGILNGAAGIAKGIGDYMNTQYQASSKEKDAQSAKQGELYSQTNDLVADMQKTLDAVQQAVQAIGDSNAQTLRTIAQA